MLRTLPPITQCDLPNRWNKRLNTLSVNDNLVKLGLKMIYNRWIPHKYGDTKARIMLGKTQFNNQLAHYKGNERVKYCDHCSNLRGSEDPDLPVEDIKHALLYCPSVSPIYEHTFEALTIKDHIQEPLNPEDIIFALLPPNEGTNFPFAVINTVIMIIISYIMKCRFLRKLPNNHEILEEIRTTFLASIAAFPNRKLASEIKGLDLANFLASNPPPPNDQIDRQ